MFKAPTVNINICVHILRNQKEKIGRREREDLMLEAFPAVTEPPLALKLGLSFLNFAASNWQKHVQSIKRKKTE